jgi:hypothetical protein
MRVGVCVSQIGGDANISESGLTDIEKSQKIGNMYSITKTVNAMYRSDVFTRIFLLFLPVLNVLTPS